ncbi:MAG: hypothetical protein ACUVWP_02825 [bacterium]
MAKTLISILITIIFILSVANAKESGGYSPKLVSKELGMGYLFATGGLIGGIGLGQLVYPPKPEHAGGGLVGALVGFAIGGSIGVYTAGETWGDDSKSDALSFFIPLTVSISPLVIGNFIKNRYVITWGTLFSPIISCMTYNLVKRPAELSEKKTVYMQFSFVF